jgi:hypothetical protein
MKYIRKNQIDFPKNSIKELAHSFGCFSRFEIALTSILWFCLSLSWIPNNHHLLDSLEMVIYREIIIASNINI